MFKYCFLVFFCLFTFQINAQSYELSFQFKNGNSKGALVGKRFGDKIFLEDTISAAFCVTTIRERLTQSKIDHLTFQL